MTNTPQLREELSEKFFGGEFIAKSNRGQKAEVNMNLLADFIETQIAQAEKRGEERMKEKVKKSISEFEALDIKDQLAIYISSL